jgi:hypothetical protein
MSHFLLDEHFPPWWRRALLRLAPTLTIWRVGDHGVPPRGTLDPQILEWCEQHDFLLITKNRRSMPIHLADHLSAGRHVPGILLMPRIMTMHELVSDLLLVEGASFPDDYRDKIVPLPLT